MDFSFFAQVMSSTFVLAAVGATGASDPWNAMPVATPTHEFASTPATAPPKKPDRILAKSHRVVVVVRISAPDALPRPEFD